MRRFVFIIGLVFALFLVPQVKAEQVNSFEANYYVQKDGSVKVIEEIKYFFTQPRHGIFRTIPFLKTNQDKQTYKLDLNNFSVNHPFSQSIENNQIKLKIGEADKTITGEQTYIIEYQIKGGLTYFSDHDEFYWNVNGNDWEVPILSIEARVHFPQELSQSAIKTQCYTGRAGSKEQACEITNNNQTTVFIVSRPLGAGEGLTLVYGFPKNLVAKLEPKPYTPFWQSSFGQFLKAIFLILFSLGMLFWYIGYPIWIIIKWFSSGRDPKSSIGQASAWFSIPKVNKHELSPAEAGTLIDEQVAMREFFATLVDLARRGYLVIEERTKNNFFLLKNQKNPPKDSLRSYEAKLINNLFAEKTEIKVKDTKIYTALTKFNNQLYSRVVDLALFPKNPQSIRIFYGVMAVLALMSANIFLFVVSLVFGMQMPKKTVLGADTANMVKALKSFITSQERQLTFQADKQVLFEKMLPFAIAFGVEKIWAKRFSKFDLKNPDWYQSHTGQQFNSLVLANSLKRSFTSMQSSMTSTTSSSGFSSGFSSGGGSGSSGGGGGGGGGGSW